MENFAIPAADRETAILPGTEGATNKSFDLQRFGPGNPFGITPVEDGAGDTSEGETTPETPDTNETTETTEETTGPASTSEGQTPNAAPAQTPAQGHSAAPTTGESPAAQDPLAAYRQGDGQLDIAKLSQDINYHKGEVGRLRNELGAARAATKSTPEQASQPQPADPNQGQAEPDWEAMDEQFMAEFAKAPSRTFFQAVQAVAQEMVKPIQQQIAQYQQERGQQQFADYVATESTTWWDNHKGIPDSVRAEMDAQFDHWAFLLQVPDKKDPSRPAKTPSELLDMLHKLAQGSAAPQAIQQAAEAAASAAVQGQSEKLGAQAGTGATKAPAAPSNLTGLEELAETARSVRRNAFGIMGG